MFKRNLVALLSLLMSANTHGETLRLKTALLYLKVVNISRLLFLSLLGLGVCLVFLLSSLLLLHAAVFLYAPLSNTAKLWLGVAAAGVYLAIAGGMFYILFAETKWTQIFHAQKIMEDLENSKEEVA